MKATAKQIITQSCAYLTLCGFVTPYDVTELGNSGSVNVSWPDSTKPLHAKC